MRPMSSEATESHEITVQALRDALQSDFPPRLLDVREPHELRLSQLPNAVHIPMDDVPNRLEELDPDADWVVFCRSGRRSGEVVDFLRAQGYSRARNLVGGINEWAKRIDRSLRIY